MSMARALSPMLMLLLGLLLAGPAQAQETWPARPVTILVPFPPGGIADVTARPLGAALERHWRQPVVVANKAGAAGAVGMQAAAVSRPDGYTLLLGLVSISLIPEVDRLFGRPPTYTREQFTGIARLNADPPVLIVGADRPWKTLAAFLEEVRRRPGEVTFASSGLYGASHVPMEMLLQAAGGLRMRHLPTAGGGPATTALLGGHAQAWASPPALAMPHVKAGKVRPLATWGATRLASFPDVPTLKELGIDLEYYLWAGLFAPQATPAAVVERLRDGVRRAVQDPEFVTAMARVNTPIAFMEGEAFRAWWQRDAETLAAVVRRIGKVEAVK